MTYPPLATLLPLVLPLPNYKPFRYKYTSHPVLNHSSSTCLWGWNRQRVPKRRLSTLHERRGLTQKTTNYKHNVPYIFLPHLCTLVSTRLNFPLLVYPPGPPCRRFETQWPFNCSPGYDGDALFSVSERCRGTQWGRCESCFWLSLSSVAVSSSSVAQFMGRTNMLYHSAFHPN